MAPPRDRERGDAAAIARTGRWRSRPCVWPGRPHRRRPWPAEPGEL